MYTTYAVVMGKYPHDYRSLQVFNDRIAAMLYMGDYLQDNHHNLHGMDVWVENSHCKCECHYGIYMGNCGCPKGKVG